MKNFITKSVILIILLAFIGCSSSVDSLTPDCIPVICKNGATSNSDCGCNCPTGYIGADCSVQKQPTKIAISKIEIISFPKIDPSANSGEWDYDFWNPSQNPPDIAIVITGLKNQITYSNTSNSVVNNAKTGTIYAYNYLSFNITNVSDLFIIELRDIDDNTYQVMDTYVFTIYDAMNGFPSVVYVNHGETKYKIYVSYTW